MTDEFSFQTHSEQIAELYDIVGEHKRREEAMTKMIHEMGIELEILKRKMKA